MDAAAIWPELRDACGGMAPGHAAVAAGLRDTVLEAEPARGLSRLLGRVLQPVWLSAAEVTAVAEAEFNADAALVATILDDLAAITARNLESGGIVWTWLANRGFHALAAHRVINALWRRGEHVTAQALKAGLAPLGTDIHPAAWFGRRIFLDHGVGLVVGETAVIGDDVSIWHGVTLGSTLMQAGDRHPKIGAGAIIGGGATILGNITVGEGAIVAAGSLVLHRVPPFTVVAGNPAVAKPGYRHPFGYTPNPRSEVS